MQLTIRYGPPFGNVNVLTVYGIDIQNVDEMKQLLIQINQSINQSIKKL